MEVHLTIILEVQKVFLMDLSSKTVQSSIEKEIKEMKRGLQVRITELLRFLIV